MEKVNLSSDEGLKNTWEYAKLRSYGFSWPERNYICSFCKKEFKSAQALGGHMNVHRREGAKMRVPLLLGDDPNPNNIFSSASSTSPENGFLAPNSSLATAADVPVRSPFDHMGKGLNKRAFTQVTLEEAAPFDPSQNVLLQGTDAKQFLTRSDLPLLAKRNNSTLWKEEILRIDLNMSLVKDDLDLELRLGQYK